MSDLFTVSDLFTMSDFSIVSVFQFGVAWWRLDEWDHTLWSKNNSWCQLYPIPMQGCYANFLVSTSLIIRLCGSSKMEPQCTRQRQLRKFWDTYFQCTLSHYMSFPSPKPATTPRLKSPVCLTIYTYLNTQRYYCYVQCKQTHPGLEFRSPCPFPMILSLKWYGCYR